MRVGRLLVVLLVAATWSTSAAAARLLAVSGTCSALTSTSLQFKGAMLASATVNRRDECCDACLQQQGCQMWWANDDNKGSFSCEMYGLDKGPVSWNIRYTTKAGVLTTGPSALVELSSDCDGEVWLFKGITFDGIVKGGPTDPYVVQGKFQNGFTANTWQECCKGALQAPGTTLMERSYQYRGRQYWTWNESERKCYVKVRPFQIGAQVLTMRRASGVISGMFGNEP